MLERLVSRLVSNQVAGLKRRISGLSLIVFALLLLALAAVFAFLALHLWLSTIIEPWQAALTVAGLVVLVSLALWLAGRAKVRRERGRTMLMDDEIQALIRQLSAEGGLGGTKPALGIVAAAALIGLIIGRRAPK